MTIKPITEKERAAVLAMMEVFYRSPAVHTNGSAEIFQADVQACIEKSPYLEGYVFEGEGTIQGYGMLAKSFSTEFGKPCIWIEDIYVKEPFRGLGIGSQFLAFVEEKYPDALLRLEAEEENRPAVHVYEKRGFTRLPYLEMFKLK